MSVRRCINTLILTFLVSVVTNAQAPSDATSHSATAAEYARGLELHPKIGLDPGFDKAYIPPSQVDTILHQLAQDWLRSLGGARAKGLQLDQLGRLYVVAGDYQMAKRQFDERLSTGNLGVDDRAYMLLLAVRTFASMGAYSDGLQYALQYLTVLDSLPSDIMGAKLRGHGAVAEAYYESGNGLEVVRHVEKGLAYLADVPYERRDWIYAGRIFLMASDVLSGLPNGKLQIDSIGIRTLAYAQVSPQQIASDSTWYWLSLGANRQWKATLNLVNMLGKVAQDIEVHYWLNAGDSIPKGVQFQQSVKRTFSDGKIRLVEYGHRGCGGCMLALPWLESMRKTLSVKDVDVWFVSQEMSICGADNCHPNEKARMLKNFYVDRRRYTFPIGIWIGPLVADPDAGNINAFNPVIEAYEVFGTPTFVITDGNGIVRHVGFADSEDTLKRALQYLIAERKVSLVQ